MSDVSMGQSKGGVLGVVFGRKNLLKTITIILLVSLLTWLGLWQLDRLEWRRSTNAELAARLAQPPTLVNSLANPNDLLNMTDQRISANGQFDYAEQIILKNQNSELTGTGVHLVAPYVLDDGRAILVDRGWISTSEANADNLAQFNESFETIAGVVQPYQTIARNDSGVLAPQSELFRLTYDQLQSQSSYELLPVILLQTAETNDLTARPYRTTHEVDLSEGSHLSYAFQWFSFAIICSVGYAFYLKRYP